MRFVCAICGKAFISERDEAEARAELESDFPGIDPEECWVICDACYRDYVASDPCQP